MKSGIRADIWLCAYDSHGRCEGPLEAIDDIVRYSAFGLLLWLAVITLRDFCDRLAGRLGALSGLSSAAYLLATKPGLNVFGLDLDLALVPIYAASPALVWLFCLSQFDDNFEVTKTHWGLVVVKMLTGGAGYISWKFGYLDLFWPLMAISTTILIGLLVHLALTAWRGRHDDLVEDRRRFRSVFVTGVILISGGILVSETYLRGSVYEGYGLTLQALAFLSITVFLLWRLSSPGGEDLFFRVASNESRLVGADHCDLTPADQHDLDGILALDGTELVLEPGLTIAKLASRLKIPEHRLRHLINQHMGYRNFADFLNHHRIQAAKSRLSDVNDRNTPVLTVAMDMGYGSLGPFNRAFKERTGLTPTEFRMQSLMDGVAAAK